MESVSDQVEDTVIKWCDCGCSNCCSGNDSSVWLRSVKRKLDERDDGEVFVVPGVLDDVARVDIGNECMVLREMVNSQQETIQDLSIELDEERNAASSAANEAMSMILRLQSEKAEVQMEARQFKRFSEEKMAHDQQEIMALEDCLYKREQTIEALTCEVHAYKHRMLSYGLTESEADGENGELIWDNEMPAYNYPPLKCKLIENHAEVEHDDDTVDIEQYAYVDSPRSLRDIEERINELENSPRHSPIKVQVQEKVVIDHSDSASECGDDMSDRVYTVDSIHNVASFDNDLKANITRNESSRSIDIGDVEVKKLYARLHALEADRESMKHALISMRTEKAQLVLLKEIAQHLYKDMPPASRMPVKKRSVFGTFSFLALFKWIVSFLLWRRGARQAKYMFGMSASNAGLLMLVDNGPQMGQWRCLSRTQFLKY